MELGKNLVSIKSILGVRSMLRFMLDNSGWMVIAYIIILSPLFSIAFAPDEGISYLAHLLMFMPYGFLFGLMSSDFVLLLGFPLYGEFIQIFFPWKYFDLVDMSLNIFGSFMGFFVALSIKRRILFS
jgi:glycopeptide antibiotics resistance protein